MTIKNQAELDTMREAGRIAAWIHAEIEPAIVPGVTTGELERIVVDRLRVAGASSSFYGYLGLPGHIRASEKDEVVHGIPGRRILQLGDIITLDISAYYRGFHGDSAWTYPVGIVADDAARLLRDTEAALSVAIAGAGANTRLGSLSHTIETFAEQRGYGMVPAYGGHGVGREMHEEPHVANRGEPGRGQMLRSGPKIAIEPMFMLGGEETRQLDDGWTVVTVDGSWAAHFERTVVVTADGGGNLDGKAGTNVTMNAYARAGQHALLVRAPSRLM
ncbi:MAG: type I methionyl aminopeptidase [Chloroflexia bacterium]|nr:type I methionyl aminopeptidase [Chloroflexia bacterium]